MILLYGFVVIGFFIVVVVLVMKMGWIKEGGNVDWNDCYFVEMYNCYNQNFKVDSVFVEVYCYEVLEWVFVFNNFYLKNVKLIFDVYICYKDEKLVFEMFDVVDIVLFDNQVYKVVCVKNVILRGLQGKKIGLFVYDWMNIDEWKYFIIVFVKDKELVDLVEKVIGVEGWMIVCCLVGEQVCLFNL